MSSGLEITEHASLRDLNTLAVVASARYLVAVGGITQLREALGWAAQHKLDTLVLGGGSNLVFAGDYDGLVLHMAIRGRRWEQVNGDAAVLVLGAGENWHDAVLYAARSGYRGIENLALIPGTAGAAPVQNIGAYGVELGDTLKSVMALDCTTMDVVTLTAADCEFGYRDSLFKRYPGRYIILEIRLGLSRSQPLKLGYRDLQEYLGNTNVASLTPLEVAEAVMAVRRRKLPDPSVLPNVGSFFKNPVVDAARFEQLQQQFPGVVSYPADNGVKLAAAWLIDQAGWKGFRNAQVGIHNRQALVLINHSGGSGEDVLGLAEEVLQSVQARFGVELEMEPGVVGRR
ncbi:UDP-N-acetylmuramate dehydrogenase [Marinobacter halophilus]|uniref:UDP-N-acetylenolpyruvoylglucosamine reductase n=1 Tax=Marinobacter halophilus TaxID=1323740 RepID=A0A2T1K963_9GAMM|nr:UDP-N-acetylmuramate dehydrogenase [Marinobacter halophilus]PSF06558.1 UDP-N-acetylenolpyruvoylglucosamine reductase [Marinobacter halophilus]GGC73628.1 UDP-N-acetylenolpyruvoylglucosamine reductase [Marinobacter halophilus]